MLPKFRAWDKKHEVICEVLQIHFDLGFVNCINEWIRNLYFDDCILMQSTGLKDKNGKEIFEGDIVKAMCQGYSYKGYIKKRNDGLWLIYPEFAYCELRGLCPNRYNQLTVEIIGNIYENKGLLEG